MSENHAKPVVGLNSAKPFSPLELVQARLRLIRASVRVQGTPAQSSQALDDMRRLFATIDALDARLAETQKQLAEHESDVDWVAVAVESNKAVDAYLRTKKPDLPEAYGMPVDGVRIVVEELERDVARWHTAAHVDRWADTKVLWSERAAELEAALRDCIAAGREFADRVEGR